MGSETERIKPQLYCERGKKWFFCGWVKRPCWSCRHAQSSIWLNMNCGTPLCFNLIYLMSFPTMILSVFLPQSGPLILQFCYQRVSPSIENWSYFSAGGNIFDIWLFKCTLAVFLFIEAQSWECSLTLRTPRKAPRSDRLSSVEKWQDNPMEGKWSELISYNGQKKEMDCGRGERV